MSEIDYWISVKDNLPAEDEKVFFVCGFQQVGDHKGYFRSMAFFNEGTDAIGNKINYWSEFHDESLIENVTHWMRLPEPPK